MASIIINKNLEEIIRYTENLSIEAVLLMVSLFFIVLAKSYNPARFYTFLPLFLSDRYLKIYGKEQSPKTDWFNVFLFIAQLIILTLIISFALRAYNFINHRYYIVIALTLFTFISVKYLIEKTVAAIFEIDKFISHFHFYKLSYKNLIPVLLLPLLTIFIFAHVNKKVVITSIIIIFLLLNIISLTLTIKKHQKEILQWLFYFILYLCALEILPYLIAIKLMLAD
ncbi:DUF4271 domain-containing protein [Abyssalbus ytuae]|uniref:DUF4271 domain-containing protein n=1 Tax=Abyssalbus ytuae TaxID=2926907 RepID=A0A9E6ZW44_9FLAO|nr:DUF4271 domain-containing protein [Abyssalbus ytuae]UOB16297.1 DUF4271 domain-containing protein [Abyssalbus ytuae]